MNKYIIIILLLLAVPAYGTESFPVNEQVPLSDNSPLAIAIWHLDRVYDGTAGEVKDTSTDSSYATHDGVAVSCTAGAPGKFGTCLSADSSNPLDGANDWAVVTDHADFDVQQAVTVLAWINIPIGNHGLGVASNYDGDGARGWHIIAYSYDPSFDMTFRFRDTGGTLRGGYQAIGMNPADGLWHLVGGSFDGQNIRYYWDGAEIGTPTATTSTIGDCPGDLVIGTSNDAFGDKFDGYIDDVMFWGRVLTGEEIDAIYHAQVGVH